MLKKIGILFAISLLLTSCARTEDELAYKDAAGELKVLLLKLDEVPVETETFEHEGTVATSYDHSLRVEHILKVSDKWKSVTDMLKDISFSYPQSKWADDSLFLLVLLMQPNPPEEIKFLNINAEYALKELVYGYPSARIERWTLNNIKFSYLDNYRRSMKNLFHEDISFDEYNRVMMKYSLSALFERAGKVDEAMNILKELKGEYPGSRFDQLVESSIKDLEVQPE